MSKTFYFTALALTSCLVAVFSAHAAGEPYSAYAARVEIKDVQISRNGQVVLTHAVEDEKHILRGWRLENGDGIQIGAFEPRRWGVGAFELVFALSFDGRRIAQNYCEVIGKSSKGVGGVIGGVFGGVIGGLVGSDDGPSPFAGQTKCERISLYDWSGKELESHRYEKTESVRGKGAPCGMSFGPDGRLYACGRSGVLGRAWDYYDEIKVFQSDLAFQTNLTFGYKPTVNGFMGRSQIYGFRISDDGSEILAWGFGYYTNDIPDPEAYPDRGGQVWKAALPSLDCAKPQCLARENITYLFDRDRPARKETLEEKSNALADSRMIIHAVEVGDVVAVQSIFSYEPSKAHTFETFNKKEAFHLAFRWDSDKVATLDATFFDSIASLVPPIASRNGSLLFKLYDDQGTIEGRWLQSSNTENRRAVVVDRLRGYLAANEIPLEIIFPDDSNDVLMVTNRRITRILGPATDFFAAAASRAKNMELAEVGFAQPALDEWLTAVKASPAWNLRTQLNILDLLLRQMTNPEPTYSAVQLGQFTLAAADVFARENVGAMIGFNQPDGITRLDPPTIGELSVAGHPLTGVAQTGDHIVSIAGQPVYWNGDIGRVTDRLKPGQTVEITLMRDGAPVMAQIRLLERPGIYVESDLWARYGLMAVQYGHLDIARAAASRLRDIYRRADASGNSFIEGSASAADLIDILVLGETQGADAAYEAILNQGGQLKRLAAALVIAAPQAARILYEDHKKLAYVLGRDEIPEYAIKMAAEARKPQPFVDPAGNVRQPSATVANPPAPASSANASPADAAANDNISPPATPGGTVLD